MPTGMTRINQIAKQLKSTPVVKPVVKPSTQYGGSSMVRIPAKTSTTAKAATFINQFKNPKTTTATKAQTFVNQFKNPQTVKSPTIKSTTSGGSSGGGSYSGGGSGSGGSSGGGSGGSSGGAGGGSTGGGGSSGGSTNAGIDQKFTGWASGPYGTGIKPDMAVQLMENPDAFLRQVMYKKGLDPDLDRGAAGSASPYIQDMNQLAMIMLGTQPGYGAGDLNTTLNWMGNFIDQGMTPGGSYLDFNQGLNNLTNAGSSTPLYSHLTNNLTSQGQASEWLGLASALANATLHPLWARAFQDEARFQGDAYVSKSAANEMDNFPEWVRGRMGL